MWMRTEDWTELTPNEGRREADEGRDLQRQSPARQRLARREGAERRPAIAGDRAAA